LSDGSDLRTIEKTFPFSCIAITISICKME
jgi:hypothetical protein